MRPFAPPLTISCRSWRKTAPSWAFLCDPEHCLRTALAIRAATLTQDRYCELQLRIGIDLGNARIAGDELGHPHVTGEGRQDADRLMRQGPPRQISVSRRFVELLLRSAPEMAELLEYRGLYSDNLGQHGPALLVPSTCDARYRIQVSVGSASRAPRYLRI